MWREFIYTSELEREMEMSLMNQLTTSLDELEQHFKGEKKIEDKKSHN